MKDSKDILQTWIDAVNQQDVAVLTALYNESAILIPTFSNRILRTPEMILDYFERLVAREGLGIKLRDRTLQIQGVGGDIYALSGIYRWQFVVEGELLNFEARFSYAMNTTKESPIMHHHSSQIPRVI
jgi:hypothetical protein